MNRFKAVLSMVNRGLYVYPVVPNSKQPIKNYSYLKATQDINLIKTWFSDEPNINIGVNLSKSRLLVVDIDNHNNDLMTSLKSLYNLGYILPSDYVERTQSGGLHYYFRANQQLEPTRKIKFVDGVDILGDFVISSPSTNYKVLDNKSIDDIPPAPDWVIKALEHKETPTDKMKDNPAGYKKYYTGYLIDEIVNGVDAGSRNNWIASIFGKLLRSGASPRNAYDLITVINKNYVSPPLDAKELDAIAESILNRFTKSI